MNSRPRMDVDFWNGGCDKAIPGNPEGKRSPPIVGLIGTLVVHAIILQSAVLGSRAPKIRPPEIQSLGATLIQSSAEPAEPLVLIEVSNLDVKAKALSEDFSSLGTLPNNFMLVISGSVVLPHVDIPRDRIDADADTVATIDSGDSERRALLFGRYSGQIQARVERAWQRPRSPVNEGSSLSEQNEAQSEFRCKVRILQDTHGVVQEVQMLDCSGSISWQQSLVTAILAASPLPAPPNPSVFTTALTMTFEGHTYAPGVSTDGYETERSVTASTVETSH